MSGKFTVIKIIQCTDPLMWYAGFVGKHVPFLGRWNDGFKSQEPAGYINIVKYSDGLQEAVEKADWAWPVQTAHLSGQCDLD